MKNKITISLAQPNRRTTESTVETILEKFKEIISLVCDKI